MNILVNKPRRELTLYADDGEILLRCRAGIGRAEGPKRKSGDLCTPEGVYYVCLKKEAGKYGPSLGISYPSAADAKRGAEAGLIGADLLPLFEQAEAAKTRPPWGTALGGEICIHAGGSAENWTAGCIALDEADMDRLFELCAVGTAVVIEGA
ncbi:MAG: L,D-transpeptidase [Clostridia bacterium]|nr:L,D-transpeptidase [Clostridia bacterium]